MRLLLFGSQLNNPKQDSDVDVIVSGPESEVDAFIRKMAKYSYRRGGKLDLFTYSADDTLWSCYGDNHILSAHDNIAEVREITEQELMGMLQEDVSEIVHEAIVEVLSDRDQLSLFDANEYDKVPKVESKPYFVFKLEGKLQRMFFEFMEDHKPRKNPERWQKILEFAKAHRNEGILLSTNDKDWVLRALRVKVDVVFRNRWMGLGWTEDDWADLYKEINAIRVVRRFYF